MEKQLSFRVESQNCVQRLIPDLQIEGRQFIPTCGPGLVVANHYTRAGLPAWWFVLAISSQLPVDIHWVITAAWTFPGRPYAQTLEQVSRWALTKIARCYGFSTMPPMPPKPGETLARAKAVRQVLSYIQNYPNSIIGIAPEGKDNPGGILGWPEPGTGRFLLHLAAHGMPLIPVAVYESEGVLTVNFGSAYQLAVPAGLTNQRRDSQASRVVMQSIARLMPVRMRGVIEG